MTAFESTSQVVEGHVLAATRHSAKGRVRNTIQSGTPGRYCIDAPQHVAAKFIAMPPLDLTEAELASACLF